MPSRPKPGAPEAKRKRSITIGNYQNRGYKMPIQEPSSLLGAVGKGISAQIGSGREWRGEQGPFEAVAKGSPRDRSPDQRPFLRASRGQLTTAARRFLHGKP